MRDNERGWDTGAFGNGTAIDSVFKLPINRTEILNC